MLNMNSRLRHIILYIALGIAIALPYVGFFCLHKWYTNKAEDITNARFIIVDKASMSLSLYDYRGVEMMNIPMACGQSYGDKLQRGDMRTPEGVFSVASIEDAADWKHDFGDGNGEVDGAYGPLFIRLNCGEHKGIGIHGTHLPESLGTRASEGCIRLNNDDLLLLAKQIHPGMVVAVLPSVEDAEINKVLKTK